MDQCYRCECMGDYEKCKAADCGKHSDWITVEHKKRIAELEAEIATTKLELAVAKDSADKWFTKCRTAEAELAKANAELRLRREQMSRFPFCPDHRDKVHGKDCRECAVEHLRECLKRLEWCKPGSSKFDGTTLNDCPACGAPESTYGHEYNCWLEKELKEGR